MKQATTESIEKLLNPLPHKLKVRFALACCNDIKDLITDKASITALELVQKWLDDPSSVSQQELADAAAYAASSAAAAAYAASSAAAAASTASYATYAAAAAASTASYASYDSRAAASTASYASSSASTASYASASAASTASSHSYNDKMNQYHTMLLSMIDNLSLLEKAVYNLK